MPNHVHGIIIIADTAVETQNFASPSFAFQWDTASIRNQNNNNQFKPQTKNLSSIVRGYKIGVKKWATKNNIYFKWQPRFYDHIIRDDNEL